MKEGFIQFHNQTITEKKRFSDDSLAKEMKKKKKKQTYE